MAASSSHSVLTATAEEMKPIYMVNMPCFVNTEDTAIDMLGGQEHVAYTIKNETSTIQLRFPNHNPFAYNLIGSIGSKSGVLLRIKRKKSSISNSSTSSDRPIAEIVGKVTKGYDFKIPSDYAFLSGAESDATYESKPDNPLFNTIEVLPQSFSRRQDVDHYNIFQEMFKNSSKTSTKDYLEALQKRRGARQSESGSTACIKFDEPVPTENQLGRIPPKWNKYPTDSRPIRLYNRLKSLFADIPIWSRHELELCINKLASPSAFKQCLPFVAYSYSQGPFKGLWVRHGYNARDHPNSRFCQICTVRISSDLLKELNVRCSDRLGHLLGDNKLLNLDKMIIEDVPDFQDFTVGIKVLQTKMPIQIFGKILKAQNTYQLFQLTDSSIIQYIENIEPSPECGEMGWFSTEAMDEIRNLFLKTVVQHIDELITLVEDNVAIDDSVPMDLTELQRSIEENSVIVDDAGDNCGINIESLPKYSYGPLQSQINLLHYYLTNDNFKSTGSVEPTKRKPNKIVNTKPKEVTAKPQKVGDIRNMEKTPAPLDLLEAAKSVVGFEIFDEEEDEFEDDSDQESDAYDSEYDEENDED